MPAVTLDETNVTEGSTSGKLQCPHLREKSDENPQIEQKKEIEIKEQASQSNETGGKYNSFTLINEISYSFKFYLHQNCLFRFTIRFQNVHPVQSRQL